jgi:hypothetical protein
LLAHVKKKDLNIIGDPESGERKYETTPLLSPRIKSPPPTPRGNPFLIPLPGELLEGAANKLTILTMDVLIHK